MKKKELINREIENLPEPYLMEILDFIQFVKSKALKQTRELTLASESSLKKDWLKSTEDDAWKDL